MAVASDIMESGVVRIDAEEPLINVFRLFHEEEISGAPVVDETGRVIGVVSLSDLARTVREDHDSLRSAPDYFRDVELDDRAEWLTDVEQFEDRLARRSVADIMTSELVTVAPDTPIPHVVKTILDYRVHRVLVVEGGEERRLVGIISLFDLVSLLQ